jgi:hypothetical protein
MSVARVVEISLAAKTRTFVDLVVPRLKKVLARISARIATAAGEPC